MGNSVPSADLKSFARELAQFSPIEREQLYRLQENKIDIPTLIAVDDIMREYQNYAYDFRQRHNNPLISTPWNLSPFIEKEQLLDLLAEGSGAMAGIVHRLRHTSKLEFLYEAMCKRDALNLEIAKLTKLGRAKYFVQIKLLEEEVKKQTHIIKEILPKKLGNKLTKYLIKQDVNIIKVRGNAYSKKNAMKGKSATLQLDLLNKSGLARAKLVIKGLIKVGEYAEKASFMLGAGIVTYDTYQAYKNKKDYMRTFFSGAAGFGTALGLGTLGTTELGACAIGMLAGDVALGGAIIISSPVIGTVAAIIIGVALIGAAAYGTSKLIEYAWDSEWGTQARSFVFDCMSDIHNWIKTKWKNNSNSILNFYENDTQKSTGR